MASPAELQLIAASNRFGFKLFRQVEGTTRDRIPNLFMSPFSVTLALGMLYTGADGETERAMEETLELGGLTRDDLNQATRDLIEVLRALDPRVRFSLGNSLWYRQGITFTGEFLTASRSYFGAHVEGLNFDDPSASRVINEWVSRATEGRIVAMVESPLDPLTWMCLLNAIYFKGDWTEPFHPALTRHQTFRRADGSTSTVRMMSHDHPINVRMKDDGDVVVLELPYGGRAFTMTIALPREPGRIASLATDLTGERWNAWTDALGPRLCVVHLPKFSLENVLSLNDPLRALGMSVAFQPGSADFGRMCPERGAHITAVTHKSYVDVNEEGTEAAAATSTLFVGSLSSPPVVEVDRPFVFAIRHNLSGTILFLGRVLDPAAA